MRVDTFAKLFFLISISGLVMYAVLAFYTFHTAYSTLSNVDLDDHQGLPSHLYKHEGELKYILIWSDPDLPPPTEFDNGQKEFMKRNCPYTNCFITTIKEYLGGEYTNFDAIVFDINILADWRQLLLPAKRVYRQKYVFYSTVAAGNMPICNIQADGFFNWTWSFKLYSDIVAPFIEVKDLKGNVVAPYPDVMWDPRVESTVYNDTKATKTKTKAVAWIMNKCKTRVSRKLYARELQMALKEFSLEMDLFGCNNHICPREGCLKAVERDYYFYFAPEETVEDDYVTDEVLKGYHHNAVPIVFGGADYTQFLPYGSYVNARFMSAEKLAAFINYAIKNPEVYLRFHRWKLFYTIDKTPEGHGLCDLCNLMNDNDRMNTHSSYEGFRRWWYTESLAERCYHKALTDKNIMLSYMNSTKIG